MLPRCTGIAGLQWGRAWSSAEGAPPAGPVTPAEIASMGPRLVERGKAQIEIQSRRRVPRFNGAALVERGKDDASDLGERVKKELQWGRAWLSAESRRVLNATFGESTSFNGAALG